MRNAILVSLVGILVVSLLTIGLVAALPPAASASDAPSSASAPPAEQPQYLLRAYEGKLGVFTSDLASPDMVFDVYVRTLPEEDAKTLEKGVRVESFEKLCALVEDYIS